MDRIEITVTDTRTTMETRDLGLAAYMKMHGVKLVSTANRTYSFEGDGGKTVDDWAVEYSNSCCHRHDTELVGLRKMMSRTRANRDGN